MPNQQNTRRNPAPLLRAGRALYREATRRHRQRVLAAARALHEEGVDEEALLAQLEARAAEWHAALEADAAEMAVTVDATTPDNKAIAEAHRDE